MYGLPLLEMGGGRGKQSQQDCHSPTVHHISRISHSKHISQNPTCINSKLIAFLPFFRCARLHRVEKYLHVLHVSCER